MRVCTLKDGQVIDKKGNVLYTLKSRHKGSQLTPEAATGFYRFKHLYHYSFSKAKEKGAKGARYIRYI